TRGEGLRPAAAYGAIDAEALCAGPGLAAGMTETAHRAIPIVFADEAIGVLVLAGPDAPSADAARVLELFAQAVAVALNNALAHARSQELARLDPLTGCANRRSGLARLADELAA